jgi:hypothetical protein
VWWRNERVRYGAIIVGSAVASLAVGVATGRLAESLTPTFAVLAMVLLTARDRFAPRLLPSNPRRDVRALIGLALLLGLLLVVSLVAGEIRSA